MVTEQWCRGDGSLYASACSHHVDDGCELGLADGACHKLAPECKGYERYPQDEEDLATCQYGSSMPPYVREQELPRLSQEERERVEAILDKRMPGWRDETDRISWSIHNRQLAKQIYCRWCKHYVFKYGDMSCFPHGDAHIIYYEWVMKGSGYCKAFEYDREKGIGESKEDAVVIIADNTVDGIKAEGDWLQEKKGVLTFMAVQSLIEDKEHGKWYDRIDFENKSYWFDITAFFGKRTRGAGQ